MTKGLPPARLQNLRFTTVLSVRHVRSDERVARPPPKFAFYHSFERPTRPKWRKGRRAMVKNLRFTTVLSVRHVRSDERVARAGARICVLPQFWTSDTSEVTKGSIGYVENLRFTSVLSVRHARSDERVVKSTGAIPAPQTEKEYILTLFHTILISNLFSAVFSLVFFLSFNNLLRQPSLQQNFQQSLMTIFKDSHHFSRTLGDVWWQSLKTAITSAELWAMFDYNL